jgi:hypothetical protein
MFDAVSSQIGSDTEATAQLTAQLLLSICRADLATSSLQRNRAQSLLDECEKWLPQVTDKWIQALVCRQMTLIQR